ncbi:hypothetical protein BGW36DRAFT_426828 [Talaromyces proteolyticus]|uniref:Uncharacterized protein n=1 Tax=Talaromyces proteolyticus TaxID=1131652 RepID=A0AAD4KZ34_9EURO|nr:uncharacterized protein BGW36DRAFT_426828 [Talaromyces proteolyticus]KAH8699156.1 hypothetical protein BGW36DRAFT_426828 [Talaromyces proteolyticus]
MAAPRRQKVSQLIGISRSVSCAPITGGYQHNINSQQVTTTHRATKPGFWKKKSDAAFVADNSRAMGLDQRRELVVIDKDLVRLRHSWAAANSDAVDGTSRSSHFTP